MENDEKPNEARNVAQWFASPSAPVASAHECVDDQEVWGCVYDGDVAYAAPGANHNGWHVEHAGRARQSSQEWQDSYSTNELRLSAQRVAIRCKSHKIPVEYVDAAGLVQGRRGITTHKQVSLAWRKSDHTDPGDNFPIDRWLQMIRDAIAGVSIEVETKPKEELMAYVPFPCPVAANAPVGSFWALKTNDGGVGAKNGAPFFGAVPPNPIDGAATGMCAFLQDGAIKGYWVTTSSGQVYAFGEAPYLGAYVEHSEWHGGDRKIVGIVQTSGFKTGEPVGYAQIGREPADQDYVFDDYAFPLA